MGTPALNINLLLLLMTPICNRSYNELLSTVSNEERLELLKDFYTDFVKAKQTANLTNPKAKEYFDEIEKDIKIHLNQ